MGTRKGKKNIYCCATCGHAFVTVDRDVGVTPFATLCDRPPCAGMATSFFYSAPDEFLDRITPAYEWYRPDEVERSQLKPIEAAHVAQGGLLMRRYVTHMLPVPSGPPIMESP